jgi:hypothetical protein
MNSVAGLENLGKAGVLSPDHDGADEICVDYTLDPDAISCWITVDNISVYIVRTDEGVVVDLFPKGGEADECIASTYAFRAEGGGYEHGSTKTEDA